MQPILLEVILGLIRTLKREDSEIAKTNGHEPKFTASRSRNRNRMCQHGCGFEWAGTYEQTAAEVTHARAATSSEYQSKQARRVDSDIYL